MNIISDVAGQSDALKRLMYKMPQEEFLFVGDLIDRGPDSKGVVEIAMKHKCLLGNHEHMAIDFYEGRKYYSSDIWQLNGGTATTRSYNGRISDEHLEWMKKLPIFFQNEEIFVSHAPWYLENLPKDDNDFIPEAIFQVLWNRDYPEKQNKLQIFGHNSNWGLRYFNDAGKKETENPWAICLDASWSKVLTGIHVPTQTIYQEPYSL